MTTEAPTTILFVDHDHDNAHLSSPKEDDDNATATTESDADSTRSSSPAPTMDDPDAKPVTSAPTPPLTTASDDKLTSPPSPHLEERKNVTVKDHKGCEGVYSGRVLVLATAAAEQQEMLLPDGHGTMTYNDHPTIATYTGHWKKGAWAGQGQANLENGDTYSGEHQNGMRHGSGTYTWVDGRSYSGSFYKDNRHGQGKYQWPCGASYCGAYEHGVRTGFGKYIDPSDGISYNGDWRHGAYHGYGVLTSTVANGDEEENTTDLPKRVYRGTFHDGHAHGQGTETLEDGTIRHDGRWVKGVPIGKDGKPIEEPKEDNTPEFSVVQNETVTDANGLVGTYRGILHMKSGKPHGNGVLNYSRTQSSPKHDDQLDFYEGMFDMGQYSGRGRLRWINGDTFDGDYVDGKREGEGNYKWSDGRHYKGAFLNDQRHGFGKFVYGTNNSADWYEGEFVEGRREGKGRFVFADGSKYEGAWKSGKYHGEGTLISNKSTIYTGEFEHGLAHGQGKEVAPDGTVVYEGVWIKGDPEYEAERKALAAKEQMAKETPLRQPRRDQESTTTKGGLPELECEAVVDLEVTDAEGNKGQYTGLVLSSSMKPHGVGRMVYLDGRRIHEGFWDKGLKMGHGRCLFVEQGDFHEGEYKDNVRHGPGKYKWRDGRVFVGHYFNDTRNGKGVFTYPNGEQYEGNFVRGEKHGFGRFEFRGGFYVGNWANGRYHGQGRLSVRGEELEGIFRDGEFVGKAISDVHGESPADEESKEAAELVAQQMETVDLDGLAVEEHEEVTQVAEEGEPPKEETTEKVETSD